MSARRSQLACTRCTLAGLALAALAFSRCVSYAAESINRTAIKCPESCLPKWQNVIVSMRLITLRWAGWSADWPDWSSRGYARAYLIHAVSLVKIARVFLSCARVLELAVL